MRLFWIQPDSSLPYTGDVNGTNKWGLPGVNCPTCDTTWSDGSDVWPGVDLSHLSSKDLKAFTEPHLEEDFSEYERLCRLVQPLLPPGAIPRPGTQFGPIIGTARGTFPSFYMPYGWVLLARKDTLESLAPERLLGVQGFPTLLRFRQKQHTELLELQVKLHGLLHPDCIPPAHRTPCTRCGRWGFKRPEVPLLDKTSLPSHLDLFRLRNLPTMIVVTERFQEAVHRLGLDGLLFRELPAR